MATKKYYFVILPILAVGAIFFFLYSGFSLNPYGSSLKTIDKPIPKVRETDLFQWNNILDTKEIKAQNLGHWYLINVWASWCDTCLNEHPFLMDLARQGVIIYGVDDNDSAIEAKKWLNTYGNPYKAVMWDARSIFSGALGVSSVPATFLVDPHGKIRCEISGLLSPDVWKNKLVPLIEKDNASAAQSK